MDEKSLERFVHRNKELEFFHNSGVVLSTNKRSETNIFSSGTGSFSATNMGGYISGKVDVPKLSSSSVTVHEIWIKKDDGAEEPIQLRGVDVPLKQGQRITIIGAHLINKPKKSPIHVILVNHSAKMHWILQTPYMINAYFEIDAITVPMLLITLAVPICIAIVTKSWQISLLLTVVFIAYNGMIIRKRIKGENGYNSRLSTHLDVLTQYAYENL